MWRYVQEGYRKRILFDSPSAGYAVSDLTALCNGRAWFWSSDFVRMSWRHSNLLTCTCSPFVFMRRNPMNPKYFFLFHRSLETWKVLFSHASLHLLNTLRVPCRRPHSPTPSPTAATLNNSGSTTQTRNQHLPAAPKAPVAQLLRGGAESRTQDGAAPATALFRARPCGAP